MVNEKVGNWTILSSFIKIFEKCGYKQRYYHCVCDCGFMKDIRGKLKKGSLPVCKKCGANRIYYGPITHGLSSHPLYTIWQQMKQRCCNPNLPNFYGYGNRGITVHEEWRKSAESFIKWSVENGWKKGLQLDRIDNKKGYSPDNCRYVTRKRNLRNKNLVSCLSNTGFAGVYRHKRKDGEVFMARVEYNKKVNYLGYYKTAEEAARVRDNFCKTNRIPFNLNFTDPTHDREKLEEELEDKNVSR